MKTEFYEKYNAMNIAIEKLYHLCPCVTNSSRIAKNFDFKIRRDHQKNRCRPSKGRRCIPDVDI